MPVLNKKLHGQMERNLRDRFDNLMTELKARELDSPDEGARGGRWNKPELMCATKGSAMELRLAIEDFKTILTEAKKLT